MTTSNIINAGIIAAVALLALVPAASAHIAREKTSTTNLVMAASGMFISLACIRLVFDSGIWIGVAIGFAVIAISGSIAIARVRYGGYGEDEHSPDAPPVQD